MKRERGEQGPSRQRFEKKSDPLWDVQVAGEGAQPISSRTSLRAARLIGEPAPGSLDELRSLVERLERAVAKLEAFAAGPRMPPNPPRPNLPQV